MNSIQKKIILITAVVFMHALSDVFIEAWFYVLFVSWKRPYHMLPSLGYNIVLFFFFTGVFINVFDFLFSKRVIRKYGIRLKWIHLADLILFLPVLYHLLKSLSSNMTLQDVLCDVLLILILAETIVLRVFVIRIFLKSKAEQRMYREKKLDYHVIYLNRIPLEKGIVQGII